MFATGPLLALQISVAAVDAMTPAADGGDGEQDLNDVQGDGDALIVTKTIEGDAPADTSALPDRQPTCELDDRAVCIQNPDGQTIMRGDASVNVGEWR